MASRRDDRRSRAATRGEATHVPESRYEHLSCKPRTEARLVLETDATAAAACHPYLPQLRIATELDYDVFEELGRGGLGRIVLARDKRLGRSVALKELLGDLPQDEARFRREVAITAYLQHPAIVPMYDAGRLPTGKPFYTMKVVEGRTLGQAIDTTRDFPERLTLLPKLITVVEAVAYAHDRRIIHRDLKPSNVLVGRFGETVVIDWGLAKFLDDSEGSDERADVAVSLGAQLTEAGAVLGTPAYLAPEQARGEPITERADVFSLGCLLYHGLTGVPPRAATQTGDLLDVAKSQAVPCLQSALADVSSDLAAIVDKATAYDPGARYANAGDLAQDLRRFQAGQLVGAHRYSTREILARWLRKHRGVLTAVVAAAAALACVGALSLRRIMEEKERTQQALHAVQVAHDASEKSRVETLRKHNRLILSRAEAALDTDPTSTLAWLKTYPRSGRDWDRVAHLAARATAVNRGYIELVVHGSAGQGFVRKAAFMGERWLLSSREGRELRLWDLDTREAVSIAASLSRRMIFVALADARRFAYSTGSAEILVRSVASDTAAAPRLLKGHRGRVNHLQATGQVLVSAAEDGTIRLWDLDHGRTRVLDNRGIPVHTLRVNPAGSQIVSCDKAGRVKLWEVASGRSHGIGHSKCDLQTAYEQARGLRFRGATVAYLGDNGDIRLFDTESKRQSAVPRGASEFVPWSIALSGCSTRHDLVALFGDGEVVVLHSGVERSYRFRGTPRFFAPYVPDASAHPDFGILSGEGVRVLNPSAQTRYYVELGTIFGAQFTSDGRWMLTTGPNDLVRLWDLSGLGGHLVPGEPAELYAWLQSRTNALADGMGAGGGVE